MGSEWRAVSVGKYAKLQGGYAFKSKDFKDQGVPVVKIKNVKHREIDLADAGYIETKLATKAQKYYVKNGDTLICMTGSGIQAPNSIVGRVARYHGKDDTFLINQRVGRFIVTDPEKLNEGYLYYFLSPKQMQWEFVSIATGSANQVNISGKQIEGVEMLLPPLLEQKAIAHILGTLDDRIELNRQMNETLESMAQALFKSWFVDFDPVIDNALASGKEIPEELREKAQARAALGDKRQPLPAEIRNLFPDEFVYSDEGWIPEGWEVKTFNEFIDLIGGGTPKTSIDEYWGGDIPWFSVVDAPTPANVFVIDTDKHVTQLGVDNSSTKILPIGTTIISARGTVGKCAIVGKPMVMNQSCYGVRGKEGISDLFVYYSILDRVGHLQRGGHGSVFNTITRDTFKTIKMSMGKTEFTQRFEDCVKPFLDKILANNVQNIDLSKLRKTLLPKLLSGEIRIPDAEKMVEELAL